MPVTNSKQTSKIVESTPALKGGKKIAAKVETVSVNETQVDTTAPVKPQKGGKKIAAAPVSVVESETALVESATVSVVESEPTLVVESASEPVQVGAGKTNKRLKKVVEVTESAPASVEATTASVEAVQVGAGSKTKKVASKKVVEASESTPVLNKPQRGNKKVSVSESVVDSVVETSLATEPTDGVSERRIRSFKVKLPGNEEFEGRFTGLTPYQAANKALSKYFRETKEPQVEITFSICESTRKSRKATYTYVGRRQKLESPVTYTIQDGREIVKNFKNSLKKVKKSEIAIV